MHPRNMAGGMSEPLSTSSASLPRSAAKSVVLALLFAGIGLGARAILDAIWPTGPADLYWTIFIVAFISFLWGYWMAHLEKGD